MAAWPAFSRSAEGESLPGGAVSQKKAKALVARLSKLSDKEKLEQFEKIADQISDADYNAALLPLFLDAKQSPELLDAIYSDLMNREDVVKLPALLKVAKTKNHPVAEQAVGTLGVFLDVDYEEEWDKWESALRKYLEKQAAEKAARDK